MSLNGPTTLNIHIVDDSMMVRLRLADMIQSIPGTSLTGEAETFADAMTQIPAALPDLIILDLELPDGNGYDLLKMVKSNLPQTVVIMLSSFANDYHKERFIEAGAYDALDKITEFTRLPELIEHFVTQKAQL